MFKKQLGFNFSEESMLCFTDLSVKGYILFKNWFGYSSILITL